MARIVAGIGSSHVPSIGRAFDLGKQQDPAWKPLFDGYLPVKDWLENEVRADAVIFVYNDHGSDFGLDRCPTFALGTADSYPLADEGFGQRPLPAVKGDADLSWHLANALIADEFDLTICQEMAVDHGLLVPLPLLWSYQPDWNIKVVPLVVNVIQHPLPTARRCLRLGQALRRAVESYPADARVAIVGTGGMSHQLHGERFGHLDEAFDRRWLDLIESDPASLAAMSHEDIMQAAGAEAVELIMWLIMRGAMTPRVRRLHKNYYAPMTSGMGLVTFVDAEEETS
ncbi:class III extradiol dioxygenase family protein [Pigmentiphaga kullae]|uniref:Protocatechuate 4,5-dioxygenase beta subunit n=1 Tax=Pigmentiphaga kullae TaxID=151784 RepID=A0A4Q7NK53_9BURK|nr:class III extradiol dioxygenase family protein [Pigmentiphaga kullae]RZS85379.1 protocatechuate 4,5-dioxygenase beta subunit [Pigmentiphaga kullae]